MGGIGPLVTFVLKIIPSTREIAFDITWALRIIPSYAFGNGILTIGNINLYARILRLGTSTDPFDLDNAGGDLLFMGLFGMIYLLLTLIYEVVKNTEFFNKLFSKEKNIKPIA